MKNKKGFTLIELLAIIVILAIIAVITVPIILNIIENSKKGAVQNSAYGFKDAVNKYYLGKLSENQNYNDLDGEYTINSDGYLVENGTVKHQIQTSGQKPSGGTMTIQNKIITTACVQMGDYKVSITNGNVGQAEKGECPVPLTIGDIVNYSTSLNNVTLDNWKVFYVEGDYTYIILDDYLSNSAVSSDIRTNYNLINGSGSYSIKSTTNRADLINAMATMSNWSDLINNGSLNGTTLSSEVKSNANVWAKGAPDINLWLDSWNSEGNGFTTTMTLSEGVNNGYMINGNYGALIQSADKVKDNYSLYIPHTSGADGCYGYWLASAGAGTGDEVNTISYDGSVGRIGYGNGVNAFRPVIKLPTSVVNQ